MIRMGTSRSVFARLRARGRATGLPAALAVLLGLIHIGGVAAAEVSTGQRPTILVLPFDLYDFSLDHRAATVVPLHRWAAQLAGRVAAQMRRDGALQVLGDAGSLAALRKVQVNYSHPTACRACLIAIARHAGADLVVIGQVHKLSNLITYFDIQVDDVRSGRVVHVISMRADGADTNSMWANIAVNIAHRIEHAATLQH